MKQKISSLALFFAACFVLSCNSGTEKTNTEGDSSSTTTATDNSSTKPTSPGTEATGVGKFQHVELTHPLDQKMVKAGQAVYDLKCASCHKLTDEKLVGPGWKGVTQRRKPEWIMNFVTNTDEMLEKNEAAKNLFEVCLVKMPNQNLNDDDARNVLEFARNNDGEK